MRFLNDDYSETVSHEKTLELKENSIIAHKGQSLLENQQVKEFFTRPSSAHEYRMNGTEHHIKPEIRANMCLIVMTRDAIKHTAKVLYYTANRSVTRNNTPHVNMHRTTA